MGAMDRREGHEGAQGGDGNTKISYCSGGYLATHVLKLNNMLKIGFTPYKLYLSKANFKTKSIGKS